MAAIPKERNQGKKVVIGIDGSDNAMFAIECKYYVNCTNNIA